ncbi:MAG: T9SS type A sorting domain-containing protein, partial [Flavobacteriales bacterium]
APAADPYGVCQGNLPPYNGCQISDIFGCTDTLANNYNPDATVNDGSCMYDVFGCTDPLADNYNPDASIDDGSCIYDMCTNLVLTMQQIPCTQDINGVLNPGVNFTFVFDGSCAVDSLVILLDGMVYPFSIIAPHNLSGGEFALTDFPSNTTIIAFFILEDGTASGDFQFSLGDCSQDPIICDCDGNQHTIGVLDWLGDTFTDDGAGTWGGQTVNFNCATWGYDCGDIAGAPAEDPYGVCDGNLPTNNGCGLNVVEVASSIIIEAYPNPTSGMLTLVNNGQNDIKQIRVFDQTGKLQFAEQRMMTAGVAEQFNLTALAAGTYHVQVVVNIGVSSITVIVQK